MSPGSGRAAGPDGATDFQLLVASVTDYAIFMLDPKGYVRSWNAGAERIKGWSADEIIGQHFSAFYPEDDMAADKPVWELEVAEVEGRFEDEGWRVRKDGTRFYANVVITALRDKDGNLRGFGKVTRDLTERRELEQQLAHAQRMEAVGRLAGGIAHDFNNLLTAILGYAEMVGEGLADDDPRAADVAEITTAAERGAALVDQLLTFSRGRQHQPAPVDVEAMTRGIEPLLRRLIGEDVDLQVGIEEGAGVVLANQSQLEQIILNLVINARDAMPDGGRIDVQVGPVTVDPAYAAHHLGLTAGNYARLSVRDSGIGMDAHTLAHCFDPFFTTKEQGKGTGLGLSTVYGIVTQAGGHVEAISEPGQGTKVEVMLPRVSEAAAQMAEATTILLAEDERTVRILTRQVLQKAGYTVLEAADGVEALATAVAHPGPIDLIVTDVVMPRLGGFELVERLRSVRPDIRHLYISGYPRGEEGRLQPEELLAKPFRPDDLVRRVRATLGED